MTDTQNTTQMTVTTTIPYSIDSGQYYPFNSNSDQSQPLIEDVNEHKVTRIFIESGNATTPTLKNEFTLFNREYNKKKRIKKEFYYSYNKWFDETAHLSVVNKQISNISFLKMVGLGEDVLPYLLKEFKKVPSIALLIALEAIIGKDIAQTASNHTEAVDLWIKWGEEKDLIN